MWNRMVPNVDAASLGQDFMFGQCEGNSRWHLGRPRAEDMQTRVWRLGIIVVSVCHHR